MKQGVLPFLHTRSHLMSWCMIANIGVVLTFLWPHTFHVYIFYNLFCSCCTSPVWWSFIMKLHRTFVASSTKWGLSTNEACYNAVALPSDSLCLLCCCLKIIECHKIWKKCPCPYRDIFMFAPPPIGVVSVVYNMSLILCFLEMMLEYNFTNGVERSKGTTN